MLDDAQATTSTTRIAYKLVGIDCAWRHVGGYNDYLSRLHASWDQLCSTIRWRLLQLLVSPTKLVEIDSD
jgi:hypothetical protein